MAGGPVWWSGPGPAFVPRSRGFGAALLGLDPRAAREDAGVAIRAARHERDLLRPDLALACADVTLLSEALGCPVALRGGMWAIDAPAPVPREEWGLLEGSRTPALAAALECAAALVREGTAGVLLAGPLRLAAQVAGVPVGGSEPDGEALIDACALAVRDAAEAVLATGAEVVLEELRAPSAAELELYGPVLNLLRHRRHPAAVVVLEGSPGPLGEEAALGDAIALVAAGAAVHGWDPAGARDLFSPEIVASAAPERVQALVRAVREPSIAQEAR